MPIRLALPLTLLAALLVAACSDADYGTPNGGSGSGASASSVVDSSKPGEGTGQSGSTTNSQTPDPTNDDPFSTPDPNGTTRLERLGFRAMADQAQALVAVRYADPYLGIASALPELVDNDALVAGSQNVDCPNGGSATVTRANAGAPGQPLARDYSFAVCAVEGTTLNGALRQRESRSGKQFVTVIELASIAEDLSITGEDGSHATITGTIVTRTERTRVPDCGTDPAVLHTREIVLDSVTLDGTDDRLDEVSYRLDELDGYSDSGDCTRTSTTAFDGRSAARLGDGAGGLVAVTLSARGELRGAAPDEGEATLAASAADGSSLTITATDIGAGLAQFDLLSAGTVSATVDSFRFVP